MTEKIILIKKEIEKLDKRLKFSRIFTPCFCVVFGVLFILLTKLYPRYYRDFVYFFLLPIPCAIYACFAGGKIDKRKRRALIQQLHEQNELNNQQLQQYNRYYK